MYINLGAVEMKIRNYWSKNSCDLWPGWSEIVLWDEMSWGEKSHTGHDTSLQVLIRCRITNDFSFTLKRID